MKEKKSKKDMTFKEKVIDNINVFLSAYAIAFVIRLFLIEAYQIPSQSMVPSLLVKDILMVEKATFGSRIPVLNLKIPGIVKPDRNDIVVFVSPAWKSPGLDKEIISLLTLSLINLDNTFETPKNLVKRLIGKPGDTLKMSNQILMLNDKTVNMKYIGVSHQVKYEVLVKVGSEDFDLYEETFANKGRVVQHVFELDKKLPFEYNTMMEKLTSDDVVNNFDFYRIYLLKSFPEIRVPKKGEVINLESANGYYKYLLKLLIERESGKKVLFNQGKFIIDGKEIKEWKVNDNYYFCMGDNRDYSEDCRYFGFVPEKNIFGRPLFRYWPFTRMGFDVNEKATSVKTKSFN